MPEIIHTAIAEVNFTAIDFESAGTAKGMTDAPIQIGTTSWTVKKGITDTWVSYISTDKKITWAAQKVHGISDRDIADAPKLALLWPEVNSRLSKVAVVAHGHGTEKRFLRAFPGNQFGPWIDTLTLSRKLWPELPSHSLAAVCTHLNIVDSIDKLVPDKTWHDALYDAAASQLVIAEVIEIYSLQDKPLYTLCND